VFTAELDLHDWFFDVDELQDAAPRPGEVRTDLVL